MKRFEKEFGSFRWIDLVEPRHEHLENLASEFKLIDRIVLNAMDPEHLPKYEKIDGGLVLFLRVVDPHKKSRAINIQELTTKITIIIKDDLLLTLHRLDQDFLVHLRETFIDENKTRNELLKNIIDYSLRSYDEPLNELESSVDKLEESIFLGSRGKSILREGYSLKRKASAFKKIMKVYSDTFQYMSTHNEYLWNDFQAEKEYSDRLLFYTDDVHENVNGIMNLHLSLIGNKTNEASFKTNEVMRVLTVISIFFLPLNFIVGLYGMNFKYIPELEHPHGYYAVLGVMLLVSIGIFVWVYRKGWIQDNNLQNSKNERVNL